MQATIEKEFDLLSDFEIREEARRRREYYEHVANLNATIAENETVIKNKDMVIEQKETEIEQKNEDIKQLQETIAKLTAELNNLGNM